jgi:hypothetical protein
MLQDFATTERTPPAIAFGGSAAVLFHEWGTHATIGANSTAELLIRQPERTGVSTRASDEEAERLAAISELVQSLPPMDALIQWAKENRPPQSWFDEDNDLL